MRERAEIFLKIASAALVGLLLFQLGRALLRNDPFAHVTIPALPALASATNAPAGTAPGGPALPVAATNLPPTGTNLPSGGTNHLGTNFVKTALSTNGMALPAGTNAGTNLPPALSSTNAPTNSASGAKLPPPPFSALTNSSPSSNSPALTGTNQTGANALAAGPHKKSRSHRSPMGMPGMGFPGMGGGGGGPLPDLPPVVTYRINQIVTSELLGPVFHPEPMALLGIAGEDAFLRAGTGETGLVKEGGTLGDLKLLRIGINRVLVEQNGQKQELTIFSGLGGESLLNTPDNNSNETTNHHSP